jgi:hypothetical protein
MRESILKSIWFPKDYSHPELVYVAAMTSYTEYKCISDCFRFGSNT